MAFAKMRIFHNLTYNLSTVLANNTQIDMNFIKLMPVVIRTVQPYRNSSFSSSKPVEEVSNLPEYEIMKNPPEWKYVEQLLPLKTVPEPVIKEHYPSGWKPQEKSCANNPYYVSRTKNHMLPVYLEISHRNTRKLTLLKKIQGDIWLLARELKEYLEQKMNRKVATQVHELGGHILFKADVVAHVEDYLLNKGF